MCDVTGQFYVARLVLKEEGLHMLVCVFASVCALRDSYVEAEGLRIYFYW